MRIVCDTNVLVSAILFGGRPREVLETIVVGRVQGFLSPALEHEFRAVLSRSKFGLSEAQVHRICQALGDLLQMVHPMEMLSVIAQDPADDDVLACALEAGADCLVSGDAHLLSLRRFRDILILRPAQFLDLMAE